MANWIATKIKGLRYKEHEERKHGRQKDRYYAIRYTTDKEPKEEGLGWASEGWTEAKASALLLELKENNKKGIGPKTYKMKLEMNQKAAEEEKQEKIENGEYILFKDVFSKYIEQVKIDTVKKTYEARQDRLRTYRVFSSCNS